MSTVTYAEQYYKYKFDSYIHKFMYRGECSFHGAEYKEEIHYSIFKRVEGIKLTIFGKKIPYIKWEECFFCNNLDDFKRECAKYLKLHKLTDKDVYGLDLS